MAFDFISPASPEQVAHYKSKYDFTGMPQPYCRPCPLSDHLINAVFWAALEFHLRSHVNETKGELNCICYYSDDEATPNAECQVKDGTYFIVVNIFLVRHLVLICHRIGKILDHRPRAGKPSEQKSPDTIRQDPELFRLLLMQETIEDSAVDEVVAQWPPASTQSAQMELGEFAIFYDLLRLIWVHEWAHAACGHVAFAEERLGLFAYPEFSEKRLNPLPAKDIAHPEYEIIQALEMHADEFSVRYSLEQVLWGSEPVSTIAGPRIDLTDRLLMMNIAFCIFSVWGELIEQRLYPGLSFRPSEKQDLSKGEYQIFSPYPTSHPPAALRYLRFREFQREAAMDYNVQLHWAVDPVSLQMVEVLAAACKWFYRLMRITPLIAKTPTMKTLVAYETHLLQIGADLRPYILQTLYAPTIDPYKQE